jgi:hypothetical protein
MIWGPSKRGTGGWLLEKLFNHADRRRLRGQTAQLIGKIIRQQELTCRGRHWKYRLKSIISNMSAVEIDFIDVCASLDFGFVRSIFENGV